MKIFELVGCQEYADNVKKIGQATIYSSDCVLQEVQPPIYPRHTCTCKTQSVSQDLPAVSETYMIVEETQLEGKNAQCRIPGVCELYKPKGQQGATYPIRSTV